MSITDRFRQITGTEKAGGGPAQARPDLYYTTKALVHTRLVELLDADALRSLEPEVQRRHLAKAISDLVAKEELPLNREEREPLVDDLLDDVAGLGPLEPLLRDPSISDILVNTASLVYVERFGKMERTNLRFRDNEHLLQIINRIVNRVGRRVDENSPMVDA